MSTSIHHGVSSTEQYRPRTRRTEGTQPPTVTASSLATRWVARTKAATARVPVRPLPPLKYPLAIVILAVLVAMPGPRGVIAQSTVVAAPSPEEEAASADDAPAAEQIEALIATLEDETARQRLTAQLRMMLAAKASAEVPAEPTAGDATAEALRQISAEMAEISSELLVVAAGLEELPQIGLWLRRQLSVPDRRALWAHVLGHLALTIGLGYAALLSVRLALRRRRRRIAERPLGHPWLRLPVLVLVAVLDLIPVAAFAAGAYLTLAALSPPPSTRLVALAWIHAVILAHAVQVLARAVFAAAAPRLRLLPLADGAARRGEGWSRRFALVGIYGYFAIEAAGLLGLPPRAFDALVHLLGLVLLVMLIALIIRVRAPIARWIRGPEGEGEGEGGGLQQLRVGLAAVWYVPALLYLILLYAIWALELTDGVATLLQGTLLSLLVIGLAVGIVRLAERRIEVGLSPEEDPWPTRRRLRRQLRRYLPVLRPAVRWSIELFAVVAILQAWGIPSFAWFAQDPGRTLAVTAGSLVLILLIAVLIWEGASLAISSYLSEPEDRTGMPPLRSARTRTLLTVARTALMVILSVVTVLVALSELGMDITPLLAAAGVLGLAVGFGSQKLVQDLITGFFFLLEDTFSVGDVIKVGDRAGLVEAVSIRNVRLRDLSGTVHTIPFSTIDTVSNLTKEFSYHVFDLGIAYREDVDQVMNILRQIGSEMRADPYFGGLVLADLEVFGLDAFADSALIIKGRIKTRPIKQWEVGREFNRRVKARFAELDIEIPFPHRTLYFGVDKHGNAPAVRVRQ